jgi:hypothetical protein
LHEEKYLRKLVGRNGIAEALKRLDKLTREEALMAVTEIRNLTKFVYDVVNTVRNGTFREFTVPLILSERVCLDGIETNHVVQGLALSVDDIRCS